MLVSWPWLSEYVELDVSHEDLAKRFAMSGLNHEETTFDAQGKPVVDLEVTSNRGDCLSHIGVAREAAVLLGKSLKIPTPTPATSSTSSANSIKLENLFESACPKYTARVIRGAKVGPSPAWLEQRLKAVGIASINNVVDITNYVMMECGQPLHAFDLKMIRGNKIIVRPAKAKEQFLAIDHKTYELDEQMIVIADAERAVALGGVMGGADSEISSSTTDILIEAALFQPLSIRRTARKLKLHSPSSYRYERKPDVAGVEWASLRCCELILKLAGGSLENGVVSVGPTVEPREKIAFRLSQISRVLGIDVPTVEVTRILTALGCQVSSTTQAELTVVPPTWRADLSREVDLIEEVARIWGYDRIPENVVVPLAVAHPRRKDLAVAKIRQTLISMGIDEAMTPSVVTEKLESGGSPWTNNPPLSTETPLLEGARLLRRSISPSLLAARHTNQTRSIRNAQLYEIANVVVPSNDSKSLPSEQSTLGIVTTGDLRLIKGAVETIVKQVGKADDVRWETGTSSLFQTGTAQKLMSKETVLGWVGLCDPKFQSQLSLDSACGIAEINVDALTDMLVEVRRADPYSPFPAVERDLNFIVDESLSWSELEAACVSNAGEQLIAVLYRETYRDTKKDGTDKKRILLSLQFQSMDRTLTGDEVDAAVAQVIKACGEKFSAKLLG
ncbi:MAG: phenylalanine--tRNA ligase subunit beta [Pirellulales bacterium]